MALRQIVTIDENLCNGCALCIKGCSEGALQIINGKAKLVNDIFCDGFGDCVGVCPTGALKVEKKEASLFDLEATKNHLHQIGGEPAVQQMLDAQKKHASHEEGCPGSRMRFIKSSGPSLQQKNNQTIPSELRQWPVQLHLVNPQAPYFMNSELVMLSTCSPIASADVHWRYLRNRSVIVACPKLDDTEGYLEKLTHILKHNAIPKIIIVIMEVPCCRGLTRLIKEAAQMSERHDLVIEEHIISLDGSLKTINQL